MDDGEFDRGKDSPRQRDAINLPLTCLPIAYGRFLPLDTGSYGVWIQPFTKGSYWPISARREGPQPFADIHNS
ncbi:UNVERIFIED_ORG: hypothetical protein J2W87_004628 [Pseudomonas putida]|nr:hypothetical protein [Pseudomonas putida]